MSKKQAKVILITGASSGIGRVSAERLLREGHIVYPLARRLEAMEPLRALGAHPLHLDVSDEAEVRAVVAQIFAAEGRIDVLWNNAGFGLFGPLEDVPLTEARRQLEVNLLGLAAMTQAVLPYMRQARRGLILNTSSIAGKIHFPLGSWYHASKHAVEGLSDCLRLELQPFGIDVVLLEPGFIATSFGSVLRDEAGRFTAGSAYRDLMKRVAEQSRRSDTGGGGSSPERVAAVVSQIVRARRPRTRYRVGQFATTLLTLRALLPDRLFDRLMLRQLR